MLCFGDQKLRVMVRVMIGRGKLEPVADWQGMLFAKLATSWVRVSLILCKGEMVPVFVYR